MLIEVARSRLEVSTHSRLKAAGLGITVLEGETQRFNTQPPEGGWADAGTYLTSVELFQHTAA